MKRFAAVRLSSKMGALDARVSVAMGVFHFGSVPMGGVSGGAWENFEGLPGRAANDAGARIRVFISEGGIAPPLRCEEAISIFDGIFIFGRLQSS